MIDRVFCPDPDRVAGEVNTSVNADEVDKRKAPQHGFAQASIVRVVRISPSVLVVDQSVVTLQVGVRRELIRRGIGRTNGQGSTQTGGFPDARLHDQSKRLTLELKRIDQGRRKTAFWIAGEQSIKVIEDTGSQQRIVRIEAHRHRLPWRRLEDQVLLNSGAVVPVRGRGGRQLHADSVDEEGQLVVVGRPWSSSSLGARSPSATALARSGPTSSFPGRRVRAHRGRARGSGALRGDDGRPPSWGDDPEAFEAALAAQGAEPLPDPPPRVPGLAGRPALPLGRRTSPRGRLSRQAKN